MSKVMATLSCSKVFTILSSFLLVIFIVLLLIIISVAKEGSLKPAFHLSNLRTCENGITSTNREHKLKSMASQNVQISIMTSTNEFPSCVVILKKSVGRLGNRLFMFASAYGLARTHGCFLYVDDKILDELHETFDFMLENQLEKRHIKQLKYLNITSRFCDCAFDQELMKPDAIKYFELTGYWQSFGYFSQYLDDIRGIFYFKIAVLKLILPFINSVLVKDLKSLQKEEFRSLKEHIKAVSPVIWIGIHVRRGDNLFPFKFERGYTISSPEYFDKAIAYFNKRYKNRTLFLVASDDKPYCRNLFRNRNNVIVTPDNFSASADLAVMSLCTDTIATTGSYSWWAAVLAGGILIVH